MRAKMAAHKREYYDRQQAAHRNKAAVEHQLQNGAEQPVQVGTRMLASYWHAKAYPCYHGHALIP
jgi:hypothetical protein